jgi:hypothetical protein
MHKSYREQISANSRSNNKIIVLFDNVFPAVDTSIKGRRPAPQILECKCRDRRLLLGAPDGSPSDESGPTLLLHNVLGKSCFCFPWRHGAYPIRMCRRPQDLKRNNPADPKPYRLHCSIHDYQRICITHNLYHYQKKYSYLGKIEQTGKCIWRRGTLSPLHIPGSSTRRSKSARCFCGMKSFGNYFTMGFGFGGFRSDTASALSRNLVCFPGKPPVTTAGVGISSLGEGFRGLEPKPLESGVERDVWLG